MLGYGIPEDSLERAISAYNIDYIACDAGSIDQGPDYLGRGKFLANEKMVERDLRLMLSAVDRLDVPLLVSSAGGSGSAEHLDRVVDIYRRIVDENRYELDLATIYTDVSSDLFKTKLTHGDVETLDLETELTPDDVDVAAKTVGQIGPDPYSEAIRSGADVVIGGRSIDEAPFAVIPLIERYDEGLTYHMAKILECGAMASEPRSGSDCLLGFLSEDAFEVEPASPDRRCTVQSVAAHTLYEKADPYTIHLSAGEVDVSESTFTQMTDRRVRVSNSEYKPAASYSMLVEGVTQTGYRTIAPAGIRGTEATSRIDDIVDRVLEKVSEMVEMN